MTGHIFNTVGSGVKGGGTPGYATYGATKRGLPQLTASLVKELDEGVQGYEKVKTKGTIQVHSLSPGMVFTKLLLDDSTPGKCQRSSFNIQFCISTFHQTSVRNDEHNYHRTS
mmetsp:Transcript_8875/g.17594  ORF Transcript_8875/g.17594 Transcript_8875/m.17594 type:complete len:113 (+) Transcript_8875:765-1103(+)